ncbi:MAG: glycosyltransferase [Phycisphaerales bacterium]|nr:glycosyltransferase [Phycisphaerales bacterium]
MKLFALTQVPLGGPRAHAINVIKTAGGFARLGFEVTLLSPPPEGGRSPIEVLEEHAEPGLDAICCATPEARSPDRFADWAREIATSNNASMVYARHFHGGIACARAGIPSVVETHAYIGDTNPILEATFGATRDPETPLRLISTISQRLRAHYIERGADPDRVAVIPDGVDVEQFSMPSDPGPCPLPDLSPGADAPRVVYCGHLYDWKGIPAIIDAARLRPGLAFHLVGGLPEDIERARSNAEGLGNVSVPGRVAYREVPRRLWHADVLLLVPGASEPSKDWTSPVKLGEYLASGAPIVASNIPALRDWLGDEHADWCEPDDPASLASAIDRALATGRDPDRVRARTALARRLSYPSRAAAMCRGAGVKIPPEGALSLSGAGALSPMSRV